jgi:hypothetical protein
VLAERHLVAAPLGGLLLARLRLSLRPGLLLPALLLTTLLLTGLLLTGLLLTGLLLTGLLLTGLPLALLLRLPLLRVLLRHHALRHTSRVPACCAFLENKWLRGAAFLGARLALRRA